MRAAQQQRRMVTAADAELRALLAELDEPLMSGFMTAGYGALGRYIFLAAQARSPDGDG